MSPTGKKSGVSGSLVVAVAIGLGVLGFGQRASATPLTWDLVGVTFSDGGTATGSFVFDADTGAFSAISVVTSPDPALGRGTTYGVPTGVGSSTFFDTITSFPAGGKDRLLFDLLAPMTNAGGVIGLNIGAGIADLETTCPDDVCGSAGAGTRGILAGSIVSGVSVPEPSTLFLLGTGAVVLRRRLKRR
jgi:hypothetical protein